MAYKDAERQREADRERQRRHRAKLKGVTIRERHAQDVTPKDSMAKLVILDDVSLPDVTPKLTVEVVKAIQSIPNYGLPDCACLHCRANRKTGSKFILNHGPRKIASELGDNEINRVSLPGDVDYEGVVSPAMIEASRPKLIRP